MGGFRRVLKRDALRCANIKRMPAEAKRKWTGKENEPWRAINSLISHLSLEYSSYIFLLTVWAT